ncbi:MAG: methionine synthase [Bdellovibrionota bacterium]|nr:methionine synthase [Bdellovibrionota bacterium]
MNRSERINLLLEKSKTEILVIDGAMGTCLQNLNLTAEDFGGEELDGCNENLVMTRPEIIEDIHYKYLQAGADIIETNTFGGTPVVLAEYDLQNLYKEMNTIATQLAVKARDRYEAENPGEYRFVAGSMGPTTKAISVTGGITFDELIDNFYKQAKYLYEGGADYFLLETSQDTRNIKAGLIAINQLNSEVENPLPVAVSGTIEPMGSMLGGQAVDALVASLKHINLFYLGLNCATGPDFMTDHVRTMAEMADCAVACVPNAGLPDEDGNYLETPAMMSKVLERFMKEGWINFVGGCCGTTYGHITAFREIAKRNKARTPDADQVSDLSGIEYLAIENDGRPYLVGERTNVIGSRKFKRLIVEEKFDEASEIAKAQVKKGAHIIDVCLANPDRDELSDVTQFLDQVIKKIKVPLMIDSTDEKVIDVALTYSQGKAIINSINLEDGEERFEAVVPLAKKYGAALVVGTIDDDPKQGMAVSRERKLEVATRSYDLLTKKYGFPEEDIYWDPLVFPCATGDENYVGSAVETIEGIRLIKEKYPMTKSVLGISNISFGLPPAGREVLNSVFTYHCTQSGLDLAIVNTELFKRFSAISEEEIELCNNLLWNRGEDPVAAFADFYRDKTVTKTDKSTLPLMERLPQYILEGSKDGLKEDLDEAMQSMKPLEIINGPLMAGMDVVGKLFNENKLIVAEVLQSAEAMKAAVAHLEQFMEKSDTQTKAKIILATVKGDVHDIGKNLVDIILSNNGYDVVNLGIKITSDQILAAVKEHGPDMIGLSGLLVKSAQQMIITADDLAKSGIDLPILVGGAALTRNFVNRKIAAAYDGTVVYAKDAMDGLAIANKIIQPESFEQLKATIASEIAELSDLNEVKKEERKEVLTRSSKLSFVESVPEPSDYKKHVIKNTPLDLIWKFINPIMLYGRHLGLNGKLAKYIGEGKFNELKNMDGGQKALELYEEVEKVKKLYRDTHFSAGAVYQFFKANGEGNTVKIFESSTDNKSSHEITFPRQNKDDGLCLSDYLNRENASDNICFFSVTFGNGIRELSEKLKNEGNYLHSHIVAALALESAEAYAEYLHQKIRALWGFEDSIDMTMMDRFRANYRGKRYSFGYPACPSLEDQTVLFDLLNPTPDIGVELTEGFMMDPEASVSAIVFHHPEATYYSVGGV